MKVDSEALLKVTVHTNGFVKIEIVGIIPEGQPATEVTAALEIVRAMASGLSEAIEQENASTEG